MRSAEGTALTALGAKSLSNRSYFLNISWREIFKSTKLIGVKELHAGFMSKSAFAALSLHEKNAYLQNISDAYLKAQGRHEYPLSKDALSRLRRFYSRRSMADLKIDTMSDLLLKKALMRLADAIKTDSFQKLIESELPPAEIMRAPPVDDDQLMFFVPNIHDAPIKDDVNLMDVAPFSLSKARRDGVLRYELKDCIITVSGGSEHGLASAYDYDIFLNMVSYLAEQMRVYRRDKRKGLRPSLPPKIYCPTAAQILKFCRRGNGGKQYAELENALDRLQDTRIKITNFKRDVRRETETFALIQRYRVLSRTTADKIDRVEIEIPDWVYDGIVHEGATSSILTLNPDYFLLKKPTARFIYRLARKAAGQSDARYTLADLHARSGTTVSLARFSRSIEALVEGTKDAPLPDYHLRLTKGRSGGVLHIEKSNLS